MYFYVLSSGEYSDYEYKMIYHKEHFTKKEFADMYNDIVKTTKHNDIRVIVEGLKEKYSFEIVEETYEVNNGYHGFYCGDSKDLALVYDEELNGEHILMDAKVRD